MNRLKTAAVLVLITVLSVSAKNRWLSFTYEMGFASPNLNEFIDKPSFQGFGFNFYEGLNDYFMIGGRFGWNNFQQKIDRDTYSKYEDGYLHTATLTQYRRVSSMNFMVEGTFVARNSTMLLPYISAGIGPSWDRKEQLIGIWTVDKSSVNLILRPEIGVIFPFGTFGVKLSGGYNGIVNNSDIEGIDHFTVGIGFSLGEFH